jgi:hypothetical protein
MEPQEIKYLPVGIIAVVKIAPRKKFEATVECNQSQRGVVLLVLAVPSCVAQILSSLISLAHGTLIINIKNAPIYINPK